MVLPLRYVVEDSCWQVFVWVCLYMLPQVAGAVCMFVHTFGWGCVFAHTAVHQYSHLAGNVRLHILFTVCSYVLPQVAEALKDGRVPDPEPYPSVSLFFSDICGYTNICSCLAPQQVMDMLHRLYSRFDALAKEMSLFKGRAWWRVTEHEGELNSVRSEGVFLHTHAYSEGTPGPGTVIVHSCIPKCGACQLCVGFIRCVPNTCC